MNSEQAITYWDHAVAADPTLRVRHQSELTELKTKFLKPKSYSRARLFSRMGAGRPIIFSDFPVSLKTVPGLSKRALLSRQLKTGFPHNLRARTQLRSSSFTNMKIPDLMRRWEAGRSIVSVTDLHFRRTRFEQILNVPALSDFNVLCGDQELMDRLEMMTVVISSAGNVTDIHTDDCDGSNHCFIGKKLWLSWDRMEGKSVGFEDVDRDGVTGFANFDMRAFLKLPSASWFVVSEDETLFLPGSLSHKVITLEDYIGVGSFHVALPSYIRCLRRWILFDTLDVQPQGLLERINRIAVYRIRRLKRASPAIREKWGFSYLLPSIKRWRSKEKASVRRELLDNPIFTAFLSAARENLDVC